jgi:hypothetical protein
VQYRDRYACLRRFISRRVDLIRPTGANGLDRQARVTSLPGVILRREAPRATLIEHEMNQARYGCARHFEFLEKNFSFMRTFLDRKRS